MPVVPATHMGLRCQNCLNPGGRGCSEPSCTPAWATRVKLLLKKNQKTKTDAVYDSHKWMTEWLPRAKMQGCMWGRKKAKHALGDGGDALARGPFSVLPNCDELQAPRP